jgi:hypothetical protein
MTGSRVLQEYNDLTANIIKIQGEINGLINQSLDTNDTGKVEDYEARRNKLNDT